MDPELLRACEQLSFHIGGAVAAKPLLEKLLGPSFDYAGKATADLLARYGNINLHQIFRRVAARRQPNDTTAVNPRVLKATIEEGAFATDEVAQEYYAGLLSSAMGVPEDEEALTFLAVVKNLTSSQVRVHHQLYSLKRVSHLSERGPVDIESELFIPYDLLPPHHEKDRGTWLRHVVRGLVREDLVAPEHDPFAHFYSPVDKASFKGIVLKTTKLGAELFLWVYGHRRLAPECLCLEMTRLDGWNPPTNPLPGLLTSMGIREQRRAIKLFHAALQACANLNSGEAPAALSALLNEAGSSIPPPLFELASRAAPEVDPDHLRLNFNDMEPYFSEIAGHSFRFGGA